MKLFYCELGDRIGIALCIATGIHSLYCLIRYYGILTSIDKLCLIGVYPIIIGMSIAYCYRISISVCVVSGYPVLSTLHNIDYYMTMLFLNFIFLVHRPCNKTVG